MDLLIIYEQISLVLVVNLRKHTLLPEKRVIGPLADCIVKQMMETLEARNRILSNAKIGTHTKTHQHEV